MAARTRTYAPNRIRELRTAAGLTLDAFGAAMASELTGSTIAKLENRSMALSADYIMEMAQVLGCDPSEILGGMGGQARMLPVVGRIAAGNWQEAIETSDESIPVPASLRGPNLFVMRPVGDSMDLIVPDDGDGGFIVVNPDDRDLIDRKFYVVMNDLGECTFKRFSANPLALLPCSSNPTHVPIMIGTAPFTVLGRVIYVGREL